MADTFEGIIGPELASAIAKKGYTTLTPVQQAVLDPALAGRDLRISSQTGSGKTIAIGFTVRDVIKGDTAPSPKGAARPRALVVAPTRELAKQVEVELSWLYAPMRVSVASVTGGGNFRDERRALGAGPAIVVGTPGRLLDHLTRGAIEGTQLGAVVLDEADRMLDLGFRDDLEAILAFAPADHRTHLVSATFPREVLALANRVQKDPARIEGTPMGAANEDIEHLVHLVLPHERLDAIVNLLLETPDGTTLIFARTRADVGELTHLLGDAGFIVDSLSGEMEQRERNKALAAFKRGDLHALIATDVAARGIDVADVARVLHAEPPMDPDSYTHRSGRTGRAGRKGKSSVIVIPPALNRVSGLLKRAGVRWRIDPVPTAETIETAREERLFEALTTVVPPEDPSEPVAEDARVGGPIEADDRSWTLAKRLVEAGEGTRALARMIARTRASGPEARRITPVLPPGQKRKPWEQPVGPGMAAARNEGRPFAEHRTFGEPRGLRPDRAGDDAGDRGPRHDDRDAQPRREFGREAGPPRTPRDAATDAGSWVPFRISWGQIHGADARRLLAMACRRGGIKGSDVGAIRVTRTYSTIDVSSAAAPTFERATREPDPRDPRVKIRPASEVEHGDERDGRDRRPDSGDPKPEASETVAAKSSRNIVPVDLPSSPSAKSSRHVIEVELPSKLAARSYRDIVDAEEEPKPVPAAKSSRHAVRVEPAVRPAAKSYRDIVDEEPAPPAKSSRKLIADAPSKAAARSSRDVAETEHAPKPAAKSVRTLVIDRPSRSARDIDADEPTRAPATTEVDRPSKTARAATGDRRPKPSQPERYARRPATPRADERPTEEHPRPSNDGPRPDGDRPRPPFDRSRPSNDRGNDRPRPPYDAHRQRPSGDGPRPGGDRPRPPYEGPRPGGDRPRPPYQGGQGGPRPSNDGPRPPYDRSRPQGDGPRPGGDRPRPPYQGGPRPGGDAPRPGGDRPRPPSDGPRPGGDRPRPPYQGGPRPGGGAPPSRHGDARPKHKKR